MENRIVLKMEIELKSQRSQPAQYLKSQLQTQLRNSMRIIKKKKGLDVENFSMIIYIDTIILIHMDKTVLNFCGFAHH